MTGVLIRAGENRDIRGTPCDDRQRPEQYSYKVRNIKDCQPPPEAKTDKEESTQRLRGSMALLAL